MSKQKAKKSTAVKKVKRKINNVKSIIATVLAILLILFVLACYFYPPLYEAIKKLFIKDDVITEFRVEGDTTYIVSGDMPDLKIHFVDVGQGDCILIELPDGKNVIIDSGENNYSDLKSYIDENTSIKSFDYAIATHADSDHIKNFDEILRDFEVKKIYRPHVLYTGNKYNFSSDFNKGGSKGSKDSVTYAEFLRAVDNETYIDNGVTKDADWEFFTHESDFAGKISINEQIYEYYFDFLTPRVESFSDINYKNANDYSPIIKFTYCDVDVLFTGDAEGGNEGDAEDDFVSIYSDLGVSVDVEILKVSHHGSKTSTTEEFLELVKPEYAVIQCGLNNEYGHPTQVVLDRLLNVNTSVYRNDLQGDVLLTINNLGEFNFSTQKTAISDLYDGY